MDLAQPPFLLNDDEEPARSVAEPWRRERGKGVKVALPDGREFAWYNTLDKLAAEYPEGTILLLENGDAFDSTAEAVPEGWTVNDPREAIRAENRDASAAVERAADADVHPSEKPLPPGAEGRDGAGRPIMDAGVGTPATEATVNAPGVGQPNTGPEAQAAVENAGKPAETPDTADGADAAERTSAKDATDKAAAAERATDAKGAGLHDDKKVR
jgi:hypothetical protein